MSGKWTSQHSERQRDAIIQAVTIRELKVSHACRLAREGQLENGLPPFNVKDDTARRWVTRAKQFQEARKPGVDSGVQMIEETWKLEVKRALQRARRTNGGGTVNDPAELKTLAQAGVEIQKLRKGAPSKSGAPEQEQKSWLDSLSE